MKRAILIFGLTSLSGVCAQTITPWTEQNGTLGLGYPVPIPVDTPEPFDGFRTYNGLFTKHQSIAMDNPYINGHIVGQTHYDRDIWSYVLSDGDDTTRWGVKEGAMMVNGGIHAREWQSPETVTGIIERFHENSNDESFHQYLLENATMITIPVNNVDGFLQTQRYPRDNWYSNTIGPRDGRMRRKNLLNTDEDLNTQNDFLNGVDLNRNNNPYWASSNASSGDPTSIVYHGPSLESEPETQARISAAALVNPNQMRIYTDVHSFSMVHFANRTFNNNLNVLQTRVLADFTKHHKEFPAGKDYVDRSNFSQPGFGIGSTDEYFQSTFQIPSWTLEIEPSGGLNPDAHPNLPGVGADYGGFANNGHDGFILPESEIRRVRTQLAETFMVVWYGQAGPPSITQMRIIDLADNSIDFDAEWDITESGTRELYRHYFDRLEPGRAYALMLRFDKPMRWRNEAGEVDKLQGQSTSLSPVIQGLVNGESVDLNLSNDRWINTKSSDWASFAHYQDDTYVTEFMLSADDMSGDSVDLNWRIITTDMVGQNIDADPSTVVTWSDGQWQNYEDTAGQASINGGFDSTMTVTFHAENDNLAMHTPTTALYYDPGRNGEGFNFELLSPDSFLIHWYTFDEQGNPRWFVDAEGLTAVNALQANDVLMARGGVFGPDFDPNAIELLPTGDVEMIFDSPHVVFGPTDQMYSVQNGMMKYTYPDGRKFRTTLEPVALASGMNPINPAGNPTPITALNAESIIGSWYSPERDGEGFHVQKTINGNAVILWYTFSTSGEQLWMIGSGGVVTESESNVSITFDEVFTVSGGIFGAGFNPNNVALDSWGSIELNLQCTTGTLQFNADDPGYGSNTYSVQPITRPVVNDFACP